MTPEQINETIAQKIWGWHKDYCKGGLYWFANKNEITERVEDYTPATNFLQAFKALEKFCGDNDYGIEMVWDNVLWEYIIYNDKYRPIAHESSLNNVDAICNALIEALEGK